MTFSWKSATVPSFATSPIFPSRPCVMRRSSWWMCPYERGACPPASSQIRRRTVRRPHQRSTVDEIVQSFNCHLCDSGDLRRHGGNVESHTRFCETRHVRGRERSHASLFLAVSLWLYQLLGADFRCDRQSAPGTGQPCRHQARCEYSGPVDPDDR